jgi:polyisoprenoid-binding protein YceI
MRAHYLPALLSLMLAALASQSLPAEEWLLILDPEESEAGFGLDTTLHHVEGNLYLSSGEIRFDLETGQASGEVVIDALRTETGNEARDKKMHKAVLESARYPTILFHPEQVAGELGVDGRGSLMLSGEVTIHGTSHPLTLEAEVAVDGDRATGETRFDVPYAEWGLKNPSLLLIRVAKEVQVELTAVGRIAPVDGARVAVGQ